MSRRLLGLLVVSLLLVMVAATIACADGIPAELQKEINKEVYLDGQYFTYIQAYDYEDITRMYMHYGDLAYRDNSSLSEAEIKTLLEQTKQAREEIDQIADPGNVKINIWPDGKMPAITEYTDNTDYTYWDGPEFRPFMMAYLLEEGKTPKGAIIILAGGGYNFRNNTMEGALFADYFNSIGYQAFVLNYRVRPYTPAEAALDLQRAIRYVRFHAADYNIDPNEIAVIGSSAGGDACITTVNEFYGDILPTTVAPNYMPDEIDAIAADANAFIGMYTLQYTKPFEVINPNFPPTFLIIGNSDQYFKPKHFMGFASKLISADVPVEMHTFRGAWHGFGLGTDIYAQVTYEGADLWPELARIWLDKVFTE